jgi:Skp family chaperone for outer membrane proteins
MRKWILCVFLLFVPFAFTQQAKPATTEVAVKSTPASDALVQLGKDQTTDSKTFNDKLQQARTALDSSRKTLQADLDNAQKDIQAKLNEDKHYKPMLDHIADLQKKITDLGQTASAAFQADAGSIQQRLQSENSQITMLIPIVRKENGLPDNATFDSVTGKWTVPEKK